MRRESVISGLLILVLATSAFGCVTGGNNEPCAPEVGAHEARATLGYRQWSTRTFVRKAPQRASCSPILTSPSGRCSFRSLAQFQPLELRRFEIPSPLRQGDGGVSLPFDSRIVVLSIGSPQTDRGPPRS